MSKIISIEDVQHITNLARLTLNREEIAASQEQLSHILGYIEKLNQLDTEDVHPTSHVIPIRTVTKDDHQKNLFEREEILANAPSSEKGYFEVPQVIE